MLARRSAALTLLAYSSLSMAGACSPPNWGGPPPSVKTQPDAGMPTIVVDDAGPPTATSTVARPPRILPRPPALTRGEHFMGSPEQFNRYYTDASWHPARTVFVSPNGTGTGVSRDKPGPPGTTVDRARPGTRVIFLGGQYDACFEPPSSGTAEAPIVFSGERGPAGERLARLKCCTNGGRRACFNLEQVDHVAIEGFVLEGGDYGVRSVGADFAASRHQKGLLVLDNEGFGQHKDPFFSGQSDWAVWEGNIGHHAGKGDGHGLYISNGSDWNIVRHNELYANASSDFQVNADPLFACRDAKIDMNSPECDGVAGKSGDGGRGASDFILVESNFFHHGKGPGPNFTSVRRSVVRNNVIAFYERHGTSFWQETTNPRLGSSENVIAHNLFIGNNRSHVLQFRAHSTRNHLRNNILAGVSGTGTNLGGNPQTVLLTVDGTSTDLVIHHNFFADGKVVGIKLGPSEVVTKEFDAKWWKRLSASLPSRLEDFVPRRGAPFLDKAELLPQVPTDITGTKRNRLADFGPFEQQP